MIDIIALMSACFSDLTKNVAKYLGLSRMCLRNSLILCS
jgi:hypothetical protein